MGCVSSMCFEALPICRCVDPRNAEIPAPFEGVQAVSHFLNKRNGTAEVPLSFCSHGPFNHCGAERGVWVPKGFSRGLRI